jgi:hypothetical protein
VEDFEALARFVAALRPWLGDAQSRLDPASFNRTMDHAS